MPTLSLKDVEPGYVREARVAAADKEIVGLTREFIALGPSAQAQDPSQAAIAILRDEQARPAGNDVEGYSEWLAEQVLLSQTITNLYNGDGGEANSDEGGGEDEEDEDDILAYVPSSPGAPDPISSEVPKTREPLRLDRFGPPGRGAQTGASAAPGRVHEEAIAAHLAPAEASSLANEVAPSGTVSLQRFASYASWDAEAPPFVSHAVEFAVGWRRAR